MSSGRFESVLLNALKINLVYPKKVDGQAFRSARGSFKNYMDQVVPNCDPLLSLKGTVVDILHAMYLLVLVWTLYQPLPLLLVYLVIV